MIKWQSIAKKAGRILAIILGVLFLLLLALWIAIQRPAVQQYVADKVTQSLSRRLEVPFSIQNIELKFFNRALLEGIYIEDLRGDTLLYAGRLEARLSLFAPFRQQLEVKGILLEQTVAHLKRSPDSTYNFQFIIDAFSNSKPDTSREASPWKFEVKQVNVKETRFSLVDSVGRSSLYVKVGDFSGLLQELNLEKQSLNIGKMHLKNSFCNYATRSGPETSTPAAADTASGPEFPFPGWMLQAEVLEVDNAGFNYDDFSQPPGPAGQFDPAHMHIEGIHAGIRGFGWTDTALAVIVDQLALREMNGFELSRLAGAVHMSPEDITLSELAIETPGSHLAAPKAAMSFPEFSSLGRFVDEVVMDIEVAPSYLTPEDIRYWSGPLPYLKAGYSGKARLSGRLSGKVRNLSTSRLYVALDEVLHFQLNGHIRGLPDTKELNFGVHFSELCSSYRGLKRATEGLELPAGLAGFGDFRLKGFIGGRLDSLSTQGLDIRTGGYTAFRGQATALGLPDVRNARFQLDIEELRTQPAELAGFMETPLPGPLLALGKMQYRGQFSGTLHDFHLAGQLLSEHGRVEEDVVLHFNEAYSNARYDGRASVHGLNLGAILGDSSLLGALTMEMEANGRGLSLDSLAATMDANVRSVVFRGYEYQDIRADGAFRKRQFEGIVNIDDPHLCFRFDGLADFNDSIPDFNFTANLDTAELAYLNLFPSALRLSTQLEARFTGNTLDNLAGSAALRRLAVADEQHKFYTDSITLDAYENGSGERTVSLQSDIASAQLRGKYRIEELSGLLITFVDGFFPIKRYIQADIASDSLLVPPQYISQDFRFSASLSRPVRLARIFVPELQVLDTASIEGHFNSEKKELEFRGMVPELQYGGMQFDSILLSAQGAPEALSSQISFGSLRSDGQELLAYSEATARMFRDSLTFALNLHSDTSGHKLALQGLMAASGNRYGLQLLSPLTLNNNDWAIPENNGITFGPGYLNVHGLEFSRNSQNFSVQSRDTSSANGLAPIDIIFSEFRLVELSRLAGLDENFLSGRLDGRVTLSQPDTAFHYEASLDIRQLMLDSQEVGNLALYATPVPARQEITINARLSGKQNAFSLAGNYGLEDGQLGVNINVERLQMALADFFAAGMISDSEGRLSGTLEVKGTVDEPEITGSIRLDSVSTFVGYLQSRYQAPGHTIQLRADVIDIGRMELLDANNRSAILEGRISHRHFNDIELSLSFSAPAFQVLNTGPQDNDLFYGKILVSIDASIRGPLASPAIEVYTQTLPGTRLTALPLSEEEAIAQEGFILYGKPSEYEGDTSQAAVYQTTLTGYELNLQLALTPDAELIAIIDPATGDQLTARGRANLIVEMDKNGQLSTTGDIYITEGAYFFNYEGLVKRTFQIREGSQMFLPGDPLEARFDVTAQYSARTSTYELISQQAGLSPEEARAAKRRTEVLIIMNLKGTLSQPEITFDIRMPEAQGSAVAAAVENKLALLRESSNELNKQVFGLLIFNSFIAEKSGSTSLAETGENIALSSVSSLVTNQLNRLASQYIKGVDLEIRLDSYKTAAEEGAANTVTDIGLGLSKQLFNDRLSVQVGGTVGLGDDTQVEEFTTLASEFLLEYKLTEDGRYRVRVFRRPDYDIIKASNTVRTGVSILYKKSFGGSQVISDTTKTEK